MLSSYRGRTFVSAVGSIPPAMQSITFIGTGLMGLPMAQRLQSAGFPLTIWNRTRAKAEPLLNAGARWAETPADAARGGNIVITMLTNAPAVEEVLFKSGAAEQMPRGAVVIDMTSTSPPVARDHAARLASRGIDYIDAPVSGGTRGAAAGTLAIMAGGDAQLIARVEPVFTQMGNLRRVGPVGSGQLCKLANQLIVAVTIGAVAEALTLAHQGGADPAAVREALRGGFAESRILAEHGQRMIARDFVPGGLVHNQIKDLDAAQSFADSIGIHLPLLSEVRDLFHSLRAHSGGELDHSALLLEIERQSATKK
jgi:2-hydroxy-3-oxopropionate reductase